MKEQSLDRWNDIKKDIHNNRRPVYARRKEIWWCAIGSNIGFEQDGKNNYFERPVLVLKRFNKELILVVSLTSVIKSNPYYYQYKFKKQRFSVILSQVKTISTRRLLRKQGIFPENDFKTVRERIKLFC